VYLVSSDILRSTQEKIFLKIDINNKLSAVQKLTAVNSETIQPIFILIELMNVIANPAAAAIRQYFRSIKITGVPSVVGHFRIAEGAAARADIAANSGLVCNT
jgi:hypothetical protein